jgi:hypothetical protein
MNRNEFERVWHWLAAAVIRYGDTHSKEDVWGAITRGTAQLHPLPNGAIVTSIENYPSGRKEMRCWLAGGNLREIQAYEPTLCRWAKEEGCHVMAIVGRRGWGKSLDGYNETAVVLTKELA